MAIHNFPSLSSDISALEFHAKHIFCRIFILNIENSEAYYRPFRDADALSNMRESLLVLNEHFASRRKELLCAWTLALCLLNYDVTKKTNCLVESMQS